MEITGNYGLSEKYGSTAGAYRTARTAGVSRPYRSTATYRTARLSRASGTSRRMVNKAKYGFKEKLLLQCIVCGSILAVIMLANVAAPDFSHLATTWISARVSENIDFTYIQSLGSGQSSFFDAVKTIFGHESSESALEQPESIIIKDETEAVTGDTIKANEAEAGTGISIESEIDAVDIIRVDEAILDELNSEEDIYNRRE